MGHAVVDKKVPVPFCLAFKCLEENCLLNANKMLSGCQNARKTVWEILSVKLAKSSKIVKLQQSLVSTKCYQDTW